MQISSQIELLLIGGFIAVLSGAITSLLSTQFALKRFYAEKWWSMKVEAYSKIMEALHHLTVCYDVWSEQELCQGHVAEEYQKEFNDRYHNAYLELTKATGIGAFIISPEAAKVLIELASRPKPKDDDWRYEVYLEAAKAHKKALEKLRIIAKNDLENHGMQQTRLTVQPKLNA